MQPEVVANNADQGQGSIIGGDDAVHVGVVIDHAERVAVGDLADGVDGVEEDLLVKVDSDVPAALRDVFALDQVDEALQALVGADFKVDAIAAEVLVLYRHQQAFAGI